MKVVVVGASGNLGSAVTREITSAGDHQVVALARRVPDPVDGPANGASPAQDGSVRWQSADVSTDELDPFFVDADAVVHLAWKFQPTHRPEVTWATNAVGLRRVLASVARAGVPKIVCASSVAAYSPVDHDTPMDESWHTDGTSAADYCREKAYGERCLDSLEANHPEVKVVRIRPAFAFQRSAASEQRRIFGGPLARPGLFERKRIPVIPVPTGLRLQAIHAGDVGRAVVAAVERPVRGAFNLASDEVLRREELGDLMGAKTVEVSPALARRALGAAWRARAAPVPGSLLEALMHVPVLSTDRARTELGWSPRHSSREALEAFLTGVTQKAGSELPPLHP